jgi:hypothetical protein
MPPSACAVNRRIGPRLSARSRMPAIAMPSGREHHDVWAGPGPSSLTTRPTLLRCDPPASNVIEMGPAWRRTGGASIDDTHRSSLQAGRPDEESGGSGPDVRAMRDRRHALNDAAAGFLSRITPHTCMRTPSSTRRSPSGAKEKSRPTAAPRVRVLFVGTTKAVVIGVCAHERQKRSGGRPRNIQRLAGTGVGWPVEGLRESARARRRRVKLNIPVRGPAVVSKDWSPIGPRCQLSSMKRRMEAWSMTW